MKVSFKRKLIYFIIFSSVIPIDYLVADEIQEKRTTSSLKKHGFAHILAEFKKLTTQYILNCGDDQARNNAGWLKEETCLQDGRVHLVYQHAQDGKALTAFDKKKSITILSKAVEDGASISVRESWKTGSKGKNDSNYYHCTGHGIRFFGNEKVVTCSSNQHRRSDQPLESKQWQLINLYTSTNGDWSHSSIHHWGEDNERKKAHIAHPGEQESMESISWYIRY